MPIKQRVKRCRENSIAFDRRRYASSLPPSLSLLEREFQLADHSTRRERETSRVIVETNNSSRIHSIAHWPNRSQFHHFFWKAKANESSNVSGSFQIHDQIHRPSSDIIIITFDQRYRIRRKLIDNGRSLSMEQRLIGTCFRVKHVYHCEYVDRMRYRIEIEMSNSSYRRPSYFSFEIAFETCVERTPRPIMEKRMLKETFVPRRCTISCSSIYTYFYLCFEWSARAPRNSAEEC